MPLLIIIALFVAPSQTKGLLGPPGGLVKLVDPNVTAFESNFFGELNNYRRTQKLSELVLDEKLRQFARQQSEYAAKGDPEVKTVEDRIRKQGLAPYGFRLQYGAGTDASTLLKEMNKDKLFVQSLKGDFQRIGVGAFWVPEKPPYFQVAIILVRDPDPMAGKPGLSQSQTDPVMQSAQENLKRCYDQTLQKGDPNLRGDTIFQIIIGGDGKVSSVSPVKSLGSVLFDGCAEKTIKSLTFPIPYKNKPVTLNHPMRFSPPQGERRIGRLSQTQIESAFSSASVDFRSCFDAQAKSHPGLQGTLTIRLVVLPDGKPHDVKIAADTLGSEPVSACLLKRAKLMVFARPDYQGEVDIEFPLRFSPSKN